jgi:P-type E1-E2 ATPase
MLPALMTFGKLIEATAKTRTSRLIHGLETLLPTKAHRLTEQGVCEVDIDELVPNDRLRIHPGDRFAVDGEILEGTTMVEESSFTGESQPRLCKPGDKVFAGTVNGEGSLIVLARQVGKNLLLSRIIELVDHARNQVSPFERLSEKISSVFIPIVLVLAFSAGAIWLTIDGAMQAGSVILAILVVACPCAMGIATPLATSLAIGCAARQGILIRGGDVLEAVGKIDMIFFDKTGTLTLSQFSLHQINVLDPSISRNELLIWAATLETASEHPLAHALVQSAKLQNLELGQVQNVQISPGYGIRGTVAYRGEVREVLAGSEAFFRDEDLSFFPSDSSATTIIVAWNGKIQGCNAYTEQAMPRLPTQAVTPARCSAGTRPKARGKRFACCEACSVP